MKEFKRGEIAANGLNFGYLEAGPADGQLMLCLHGFPDHARTFRNQMVALGAQGYHVVAPYMRGYAPTDVPAGGPFQTAALAEDAAALVGALTDRPAIIVGHDWGAMAAYGAAIIAADRIEKLIAMAVPYGPGLMQALVADAAQQRRSWYMFFFQTPIADMAVPLNDFAFVERLWTDWSPEFVPDQEEMAALKETFAQPGVLAAALGYYRQTLTPELQSPELADLQGKLGVAPVPVPALYLHGRDDGCIGVGLDGRMETFFPAGLTRCVIEDAGHFLHLEQPERVNGLIGDFLGN